MCESGGDEKQALAHTSFDLLAKCCAEDSERTTQETGLIKIATQNKGAAEPKKMGRPKKEIDKRVFVDLVGLGCTQDEICWFFRDASGKPISEDTLTRFCQAEFGMTFAEFRNKSGAMMLKVRLRRNQLKLSEHSAAMAIFLGKQYLGQSDNPGNDAATDDPVVEMLRRWDDASGE